MVIRREQMLVFEVAAEQRFQRSLVEHLKQFSPTHASALGDGALQQIVADGTRRAFAYQLTTRGGVRLFLELMFTVGGHFDSDVQYPWAGEILGTASFDGGIQKADQLYRAITNYLEEVAGPNRQAAVRALQRAVAKGPGALEPAAPSASAVLDSLKEAYPEKCAYVGERAVKTLIAGARETAARFGPVSSSNVALFAGLMFDLGHMFYTDALYPWVSSTLNDSAIQDAQARLDLLSSKVLAYREAALNSLIGGTSDAGDQ